MCRWEFQLVFCAELKKLMSCVKIRLMMNESEGRSERS